MKTIFSKIIFAACLLGLTAACSTSPKQASTQTKKSMGSRSLASSQAEVDQVLMDISESYLDHATTLAQNRDRLKKLEKTNQDAVCASEVYDSDLIQLIQSGYYSAPDREGYIERLKGKTQLVNSVKNLLSYREIIANPSRTAKESEKNQIWTNHLKGTSFYGPAYGVMGSADIFRLWQGSSVTWSRMRINRLGEPLDRESVTGTWSVSLNTAGTPVLTVSILGESPRSYHLLKTCTTGTCEWVLSRPLKVGETFKAEEALFWNFRQSECDA